ncbi:MAG: S8 family serine peptidase [Burkholderiales bacterium]|nr:S8 family serine peptidase [Burkholderiales bacterium]
MAKNTHHRQLARRHRPLLDRFAGGAVAIAALLACDASLAQGLGPTLVNAEGHVPGRLIVLPRAGMSDDAVDKIVKGEGARGARRLGRSELRIVDLPEGKERAMLERLARHPHVEFAELDVPLAQALTPNDPYFGSQWHHGKIRSSSAWDIAQGAGVTIAVLDTGVDGSHPELSSRMVAGWNAYANNSDTSDADGHGTAVAGTLAAVTNNGAGVASMAGQAKIMPVRISDPSGWAYASTVAAALTYAADHGAKVANISFDGMANNTTVQTAAQYFKSKGGLVVVAAGNSGKSESIVATSTMIPVSATNSSDQLTSFTSYGPYVAMSAPGENIWTTKKGGSYWYCWGTSFASPVTAGVVALMMSANSSLTAAEVEKLLYGTAADLGAAGRDTQFGYGRVDAAAAVAAAANAVSAVDGSAPSASIASPYASSTVGGLVPVDVSASDNVGVVRVDLLVNGAKVASDSTSPFAFSWDSTKVANGMVSLQAVAVDAAGNAGTSAAVSVNVANNAVADTTPPAVAVTSPGNGATVSGTVTVKASASDNSGTAGLTQQLYINGARVASATGGSLSYKWNVRKLSRGTYTIEALATDAAGNASRHSISVKR